MVHIVHVVRFDAKSNRTRAATDRKPQVVGSWTLTYQYICPVRLQLNFSKLDFSAWEDYKINHRVEAKGVLKVGLGKELPSPAGFRNMETMLVHTSCSKWDEELYHFHYYHTTVSL